MRHISLDELKKRTRPPRPANENGAVRKAQTATAKLKAMIPTVIRAAQQHPDV